MWDNIVQRKPGLHAQLDDRGLSHGRNMVLRRSFGSLGISLIPCRFASCATGACDRCSFARTACLVLAFNRMRLNM